MRELRKINGHLVLIPVFVPVCLKCGWARFTTVHKEDKLLYFEETPCSGSVEDAIVRAAQCKDRVDLEIQIRTLEVK